MTHILDIFSNAGGCCRTPNFPKSTRNIHFLGQPILHLGVVHRLVYGVKHTNNCYCCSTGQLCLSLPCSFTVHIKTQGQHVHFRDSWVVVAVACNPLHQKAKQKYVLVVLDWICHSTGNKQMLLSCTLQLHSYSPNTRDICQS